MAVDLGWLLAGYLPDAQGRPVRIEGIERIAADMLAAHAVLEWRELPGDYPGVCNCRERRIALAPWLMETWPLFIRRVLTEEVGHVYAGPSDDRACAWQRRRYGDLLEPV